MVHNNTCLYAKGESIMKYKQVAETLDGLTYEIRLNERNLKDAKHIDYTNDIQARIILFKNAQAAIWIGLKEHERDNETRQRMNKCRDRGAPPIGAGDACRNDRNQGYRWCRAGFDRKIEQEQMRS